MNEKLTLIQVDALTNVETIRELTEDEIAELQVLKTNFESVEAEKQAKSEARTSALAKLAALGLTEEEIAAL